MNPIDRIKSTLRFKATDRVPVFSHIYGFAAGLKGVPLKDYLNSAELLAICQLQAWKRFGYDTVTAFADTSLEAEAIGSRICYGKLGYPYIEEYCLKEIGEWRHLSPADPERDGRMPLLLETCRILKAEVDEEAAVVGTVQGPMTLACQLLGIERLLYSIVDQPEDFSNLLNFTRRMAVAFAKAMIEAGAQIIQVFDPASSCSVITRAVFSESVLPQLRMIFNEIKCSGDAIGWLTITGQTGPILDLYPATEADIFNIDYLVPISIALETRPKFCINGNIKPFLFVTGRPEDIIREATDLLRKGLSRGGFILSPGCEIPLEAKAANVDALVKAARGDLPGNPVPPSPQWPNKEGR